MFPVLVLQSVISSLQHDENYPLLNMKRDKLCRISHPSILQEAEGFRDIVTGTAPAKDLRPSAARPVPHYAPGSDRRSPIDSIPTGPGQ